MNSISIQSFLKLGYFIEVDGCPYPIDFSRIDKDAYAQCSESDLVAIGIEKLRDSVAALVDSERNHVVPLSGGLDSRLILCALLEHVDASELSTYTYGIPDSYDYEIGCLVAKHAGTRHVALPLNRISYHEEDLLEVARRERCQAVLFYNKPLRQIADLFGAHVFWSGYVGDAVAGSHLHDPPAPTLEAAKRRYLRNRKLVSSTKLHTCSDEDLIPFVAGGALPSNVLTWDEQVLFDEGVNKFTVAHVLWEGFEYRTPFINSPWMDFMFSVPNAHRLRQQLMIRIGRTAYPRLFDLPCKNRIGHRFDTPDWRVRSTFWMNRVRKVLHQITPKVGYPHIQYNDFNEAIRESPDLRAIVRSNVEDLRKRGVCDWVDFDGLWRRHDWRIRNHGDALIVLASLELVLKARELEERQGCTEARGQL